jgi:uncharacterized protein
MKLNSMITLENLSIYLPKHNAIILGDIHIGEEEAFNKQGILVPRIYFKHLYQKTKNLITQLNPNTIIINGDLKHEFGTISETEWRHTIRFLDLLKERKVILIKGNHDKTLGPIAEHKNIELKDYHIIEDVLIAHGDKIINIDEIKKKHKVIIKTIIIGHEHPAITISSKNRSETYKCFLSGKYNKLNLIVMPSFNEISEGTDILREQLLSPYLRKLKNLSNFKVYVYGNKLYHFGTVKDIKKNLIRM